MMMMRMMDVAWMKTQITTMTEWQAQWSSSPPTVIVAETDWRTIWMTISVTVLLV
jgi:hypothetical protein